MKLQYSEIGSTGETWIDCQDRFDEFVGMAANRHSHTTDQIINNGLLKGKKIPFQSDGWFVSKLRDADFGIKINQPIVITHTCSHCGTTGIAGSYPFSTIAGGVVCDDCL